MTFKQKSTFIQLLAIAVTITDTILFVGCQSDNLDSGITLPPDGISFNASIAEIAGVQTRADQEDKLDTVYITSDPYNVDFYIELNCDGTGDGGQQVTQIQKYIVPPGYEGRLDTKETGDRLNWQDLTSQHTFYAWTLPWIDQDTSSGEDKSAETDGDKFLTSASEEPIKIQFHDSHEGEDGFDKWKNNSILEYFIGAKSGPYSYKTHGKYVDLTFKHLVSKIEIGKFSLVEPDGSVQNNLKADITFIGMPKTAMFYPHPADGKAPYVEKGEGSEDDGVTYFIHNDPDHPDETKTIFYVCPEIDFSKLGFKVNLNNVDYGNKGDYYGSFKDVEFKREKGTNYDSEDGKDKTILHAGEKMTLNIMLIPGVGPGVSIVIKKWSTDDPNETEYHPHIGIYSDAEVKEILDVFLNQKRNPETDGGTTQEDIDRLFEMYGTTGENGEKYFPLYENVDISNTANGNIFPFPKDYILDGMGHTITMKTNYGNNNDFNQSSTYFNIGPVRDVYLTDSDGKNSIYIDPDGYVWIADSSEPGGYKRTENKLDPLDGDYKSYDISVDGIVHRSTYYNNNITGS